MAQNEQDIATIEAMSKYGGSFIRHLGMACKYADSENLNRIKQAFPEYWLRYQELANIKRLFAQELAKINKEE